MDTPYEAIAYKSNSLTSSNGVATDGMVDTRLPVTYTSTSKVRFLLQRFILKIPMTRKIVDFSLRLIEVKRFTYHLCYSEV